MAHETWEGSAKLTGYGAVVQESYPIRGLWVHDATGERADFEISEPTEVSGPLDSAMYQQDIKLQVRADPSRVQDIALETVLAQADTISFVTDRRVQVSLDPLRKVTSESDQTEERTMLFLRRFKGPQSLAIEPVSRLQEITTNIGDEESDRGRRITRALRWLRRAYLADDEVEEFVTLAMGFEALTRYLPRPPAKSSSKKRGKPQKAPSKPGTSEVLKHWAVKQCGIAQEDWKLLGSLRHELFHGGITENSDTRAKLATALPHLRLVPGLALKHVLNLSQSDPPRLARPEITVVDAQITAPKFTPAPDPPPRTPPSAGSEPTAGRGL